MMPTVSRPVDQATLTRAVPLRRRVGEDLDGGRARGRTFTRRILGGSRIGLARFARPAPPCSPIFLRTTLLSGLTACLRL